MHQAQAAPLQAARDDDLAPCQLGERARTEAQGWLLQAFEQNDLHVDYRPTVSLLDGAVVGVEAVLRWQHPQLGRLPRATLERVTDASDLGIAIGAWVIEEACRQLRRWREVNCPRFPVAVKVSADQLGSADFVGSIAAILHRTSVHPGELRIEIAETELTADRRVARRVLREISALGVALSLGNFGTGVRSPQDLRAFPFDFLALDPDVVATIDSPTDDTRRLAGILRLAHAAQLRAIANGVMTAVQRDALAGLGYRLAQGPLWSDAIAPDELEAMFDVRYGRPDVVLAPRRTRSSRDSWPRPFMVLR